MTISIIKGTTCTFFVNILNEDGKTKYVLQSGDKLIFGVKSNPENSDYDVCKIVTEASEEGYAIELEPDDTADLPPGHYYFDIGLQTSAGAYYMVVPCSQCLIKPAVTSKEATAT